jgi:hypothetical protein
MKACIVPPFACIVQAVAITMSPSGPSRKRPLDPRL